MTAVGYAPRYREIESALHARGRVPTSRIVRLLLRQPREPERAALRVVRDDQVLELCRVRLADGDPVAVETAVLASRCAAARYGLDVGFSVEDNGAISVGSGA